MTYQHDGDLHLSHNERRGYWHFVLYIEPPGEPGSAINADQRFETSASRYAAEWLGRLTPCDPDGLHVTLVGAKDAPNLWNPCVYDDPDSPAAIARDGCLCWQTSRDPVTYLPVAAQHYRTVSGNHENWTHSTYAPLALPEGERLATLIIDREASMFWVRTAHGVLHILPERAGAGYNSGYSGGGPAELARVIEKIVKSDGYDVTAGTRGSPSPAVDAWVSSTAAAHTQELTLDQLKTLCRAGTVM